MKNIKINALASLMVNSLIIVILIQLIHGQAL